VIVVAWRPRSLRAEYTDDVARELGRASTLPPVIEADLAPLPAAVQRYLRVSGVVGQPRVANVGVRIHGRIRSGADSAWMPLRAEQYTVVASRTRLFYLTSSMFGVPVQGYHRYAAASASMHIKAAGLVSVVRLSGDELFQSETVTFLNDMCLFAPAALLDRALVWEEADAHTARVRFTNAWCTVRAELTFNTAGELIDFVSDDRFQTSADGTGATRRRWSTPITRYRTFGPVRLIAAGEGRWHGPDGSFPYIELTVDDVAYNCGASDRVGTSALVPG
jgi:hypothetical protein